MNRFGHNFLFRAILLLVIALNVYSKLMKGSFSWLYLFVIILVANETFRYLLSHKKIDMLKDKNCLSKTLLFTSLMISCLFLGLLSYYYSGIIMFYIFFILFECFAFQGFFKVLLFIANYLSYIVPLILSNTYVNSYYILGYKITNTNLFLFIIENSISYFTFFIIVILIRKIRKNKKNIYILNDELKEQNLKLKEYSKKIEELTISKERNRVAQELHDSLGHYLMAISMHLDVLDKTLDLSPKKSKSILSKTKTLVDDSIKELRTTVYSLKNNKIDFKTSINLLIENLSIDNKVCFKVNISKDIETLPNIFKDTFYKTIKESITNGLKHGKASLFSIDLSIDNAIIYLSILNNGERPSKIIWSNGLKGMEERLNNLNGNLTIENNLEGFKIFAKVPLPS